MDKSGFYRAFEDKFRGSRDVILERLKVYLPFLQPLKNLYSNPTVIDLGCGRGEWLELMKEVGFEAKGVDLDTFMLNSCYERGFNVFEADALEYLKGIPAETIAVVSGFHFIEHVPFSDAQSIVEEALRVLKPGGLLILETPNVENLRVGTNTFHLDPSHDRPIPPLLLDFLPHYYKFERSKLLRLQENPDVLKKETIALFDTFASASGDCAIVAQKNATPDILSLFDIPFSKSYGLTVENLAARYDAQHKSEIMAPINAINEKLAGVVDETKKNICSTQTLDKRLVEVDNELKALIAEQEQRLQSVLINRNEEQINAFLAMKERFYADVSSLNNSYNDRLVAIAEDAKFSANASQQTGHRLGEVNNELRALIAEQVQELQSVLINNNEEQTNSFLMMKERLYADVSSLNISCNDRLAKIAGDAEFSLNVALQAEHHLGEINDELRSLITEQVQGLQSALSNSNEVQTNALLAIKEELNEKLALVINDAELQLLNNLELSEKSSNNIQQLNKNIERMDANLIQHGDYILEFPNKLSRIQLDIKCIEEKMSSKLYELQETVNTAFIPTLQKIIVDLEFKLAQSEKIIVEMQVNITERDNMISKLAAVIEKRDKDIDYFNLTLASNVQTLNELTEVNKNQQLLLDKLESDNARLSSFESKFVNASNELHILTKKLDAIKTNSGWYLSAPLRFLGYCFDYLLSLIYKGSIFIFIPILTLLMKVVVASPPLRRLANFVLGYFPKLAHKLANIAIKAEVIAPISSVDVNSLLSNDMTEAERAEIILATQLSQMTLSAQEVFLAAKVYLQNNPEKK